MCQKEKRATYCDWKDRQEEAWKSGGGSHRSQVGEEQESASILGDPNRRVRQEEGQVPARMIQQSHERGGSRE